MIKIVLIVLCSLVLGSCESADFCEEGMLDQAQVGIYDLL